MTIVNFMRSARWTIIIDWPPQARKTISGDCYTKSLLRMNDEIVTAKIYQPIRQI